MRKLSFLVFVLGMAQSLANGADTIPEIRDVVKVRKQFGIDALNKTKARRKIEVMVIDAGYGGLQEGEPTVVETYDNVPKNESNPEITHGRYVYQGLRSLLKDQLADFNFTLLNGRDSDQGMGAFKYAREKKADVIVMANQFECCSNYDGDSYVIDELPEIVKNGGILVTSVGNYGGKVYDNRVAFDTLEQGGKTRLKLGKNLDKTSLEFTMNFSRREPRKVDEIPTTSPLQVVANWTGYGKTPTTGTRKDIDIRVYDEKDRLVGEAKRVQVMGKEKLGEGESFLALERVSIGAFSKGQRFRVEAWTPDKTAFDLEKDYLRITLVHPIHDAVNFPDAMRDREIHNPAASKIAFAVGSAQEPGISAKGKTRDGRVKPDVLTEISTVTFDDGSGAFTSTSASAMLMGATVAALKAQYPEMTHENLLALVDRMKSAHKDSAKLIERPADNVKEIVQFLRDSYGKKNLTARKNGGVLEIQLPPDVEPLRERFRGVTWRNEIGKTEEAKEETNLARFLREHEFYLREEGEASVTGYCIHVDNVKTAKLFTRDRPKDSFVRLTFRDTSSPVPPEREDGQVVWTPLAVDIIRETIQKKR